MSEQSGGSGQLPPIPAGIEQLLALAAVNEEFAAALMSDPSSVIEASGVELTSTERGILGAVDPRALTAMITQVDQALEAPDRREFLGHSTAAVLALLGGTALAACKSPPKKAPEPITVKEPIKVGSEPTRPDPDTGPTPARQPIVQFGATASPPPDSGANKKEDKPPMRPLSRGIRPSRPGASRGIRPRRPGHRPGAASTGSRPGRPE